ncbi:MAG TPA: sigma-54 dependent transcriptional regulator [Thermoanaerobaculia bacterium]|nr:sigma-54 dependent transcriptional regulator [Thermoanaerobaculia bacterium]
MRSLLRTVEKILDHDVSVLIVGESGVGKDYLASAIHACSNRRDQPFVHIDCATIPADLFESELFGYEKGTFTDALSRRAGRLEAAGGGTVYFDEISALSPGLQAKLLRAVEERRFTRLGGQQLVPFRARVITSTSLDPEALVAAGAIRRDLLYRINVVTLHLPPLRERQEDIADLARRFTSKPIDDEVIAFLRTLPWPGNVRELRNAIERAALLESGDRITAPSLPPSHASALVASASGRDWTLDELEAAYIREVLRRTRSNYSRAAAILGINRKTLLEKRRRYGLD